MLTPPSKGTPIDLEFIGLLTSQVNEIENTLRGNATNTSKIGDAETATFGQVVFNTQSQGVVIGSVEALSNPKTINFTFPFTFKVAPYVAVSIKNVGGTEEGDYVSAVIKNITPSGTTMSLVFAKTGNYVSVEVTVIAIGLAG